jgi:hypothetical protein
MRTVRARTRVACVVGAMALLFQFAPVMAQSHHDRNRPVELTFAKWFITSTLMEGNWGGNLDNRFVGELLRRQASVNPALNAVALLEAVYEFHHGGDFFTALIRGGSNGVTGAAQLDGVILAGWRTGASVHVEFDRIPGVPGTIGCAGAPPGATCFVGTIQVGRAPRD